MMRVLVGLAIASIALTGGCRQSDEAVKAELRSQIVQRCTVTNAPRAADDARFNPQEFCTCVSDRMIADRSLADIRKLLENREGAAEQGRQIGDECFKQQMSSATAAAATPAPPVQAIAAPAALASAEASPSPTSPEDEAEPAETSEDEAVEDSQ